MADRMAELEARVAALEMIFSGKPADVVGPPVPEQVHDVVDRESGEVRPQSADDKAKDVVVRDGRHDEAILAEEADRRDKDAHEEAEKATIEGDEKPRAAWLEPHREPRRPVHRATEHEHLAPKDPDPRLPGHLGRPADPPKPEDKK